MNVEVAEGPTTPHPNLDTIHGFGSTGWRMFGHPQIRIWYYKHSSPESTLIPPNIAIEGGRPKISTDSLDSAPSHTEEEGGDRFDEPKKCGGPTSVE
jgi:hypothetical protein